MVNQHEISAIDRFWEGLNILVKAPFDLVVHFGIREFIKLQYLKIFEEIFFFWKIKINFFVFQTTESIHTFLESSHQTGIIRWGQNSHIATRLGHRASFSLYWGTHCTYTTNYMWVADDGHRGNRPREKDWVQHSMLHLQQRKMEFSHCFPAPRKL